MIQPTNLGEISHSLPGVSRAQNVGEPQDSGPKPTDSVDLQGAPDSRKPSRSKGSGKSSSGKSGSSKSGHRSSSSKSKAPKAEETRGVQPTTYEKASEKFLHSLIALQSCTPEDQKFVENAIVGVHGLQGLDGVQRQFLMAHGLGRYAMDQMGKMTESAAKDPSVAPAQEKRWNALSDVIKTASQMVKAYPTTKSPVPPVADFASGAPGSGLLSNSPTNAPTNPTPANPTPANPTPPGPTDPPVPTPPTDPNQAAKDDYNNAMKIYQSILAARQKNMADMQKIMQDMQTAIQASMANVWAMWAKTFSDGISLFNRYLGYGGDPKYW